jgi:penicillin-binding protein 2
MQLFLVFCLVVVVGQLAYLQIVRGGYYRQKVKRQSLRKVWIPALRGKIYDRSMFLLAENRPSFDVDVNVDELSQRGKTNVIRHLSVLLRKPESNLWHYMNSGLRLSYEPARVAQDISLNNATRVSERLYELPAVDISVNPVRKYPGKTLASHIVGYVGKVSENNPHLLSGEYSMNDLVGKNGIEKEFENNLHGQNGQKIVEVDRMSLFVETLDEQPPIPGNDIILTVDLTLQETLECAFSNRVGAAAAIDPRNGEILALVSSPGYDPNFFVGRVPAREYRELISDPRRPLFNRAIQGQYPLGSAFKVITALAGLETGVITSNTIYHDTGKFRIGNSRPWRNFRNSRHGNINLLYALRVSCNTFFCKYSVKIGIDKLSEYAGMFGLGRKTGIELPGEASGLVPTRRWKRKVRRESWYPGDTVNVSIGHGDLLVTPLQVARMIAAIGNRGVLQHPHLVRGYDVAREVTFTRSREEPEILPVSQEALALVRQGMWEVVNTHNGSGRRARLPGLVIGGKTGSAMLGSKTYAWFTAFAPFNNPRLAIAVVVEDALTGGLDAAPIARDAFATYFDINIPDTYAESDNEVYID